MKAPHPIEMTLDPRIIAAKADVDETLIDWMLSLTPWERLEAAARFAREMARWSVTPEDLVKNRGASQRR